MGPANWSCTRSVSFGYLLPSRRIKITHTIGSCLLV
jgi:hypothetical protein